MDSVEAVELIARQLCVESQIPEEEIDSVSMAVRECMANAVAHGNHYSQKKFVHVVLASDGRQVRIRIRDEGEGFDPSDVENPLDENNLLKASGRGILLMRAFLDAVDIHRCDPSGTEVVLVKRSPHAAADTELKEEEEVSLNTNIREVDGVSIIDLSGRITLGEGSGKLRETLREVLGSGQKKVLLNLAEVSYIDSSGLGELVASYTTASNQGAKVKLLNLQSKVKDLLQITKLYTVFETYDSEAEAVLSFS